MTMKRELWTLLAISCYGAIALFLVFTGLLPWTSTPFLLIPVLIDQVYHVFYCPRRVLKRHRAVHILAAATIGFAIVELFYFVYPYGFR